MDGEDKQGHIIILCVLAITSVIVYKTIIYINQQEKTYEYAQNGEIGISSECWLDNGTAKCIVDKEIISVDNYYERED